MDERVTVEEVANLIKSGKRYEEIGGILRTRFNGERGFSVSSVKRFCSKHALTTVIPSKIIEREVTKTVDEVKCDTLCHLSKKKNIVIFFLRVFFMKKQEIVKIYVKLQLSCINPNLKIY